MRLGILGGGLTGLSAARRALELGASVELFESQSGVGGMAASYDVDGNLFDLGPHTLHSNHRNVINELRTLLGDDITRVAPSRAIWKEDRIYRHPPNLGDFVRAAPRADLFRPLAQYLYARSTLHWRECARDLEEWTVQRFGRGLYEFYVRDHIVKSMGVQPSELPALWAAQRIYIPTLPEALRQLWRPREAMRRAYYPRKGIGQLAEKMAAAIVRDGGNIYTGVTVKSWSHHSQRVEVVLTGAINGMRSYDAVINTGPVDRFLLSASAGNVPEEVLWAASRLQHRAAVFVFAVAEGDGPITRNALCYFPSEQYIFTRLYEPFNYSSACTKYGYRTMCLEIHCTRDDEVWNLSDEEIAGRTIHDMALIPFLGVGKVRFEVVGVIRIDYHYPLTVPDSKQIRTIDEFFCSPSALVVSAGRQGTHRYVNMDGALLMGKAAADVVCSRGSVDEIYRLADEPNFVEDGRWRR